MSWVTVGVAGASAVMGAQQAKRQREAQAAQNLAQSEQTRYSPWSGMSGGEVSVSPTQSGLEGAISGGLKGYMTAKSLGAGGSEKVADPNAAPSPFAGTQNMQAIEQEQGAFPNPFAPKKPSLYNP